MYFDDITYFQVFWVNYLQLSVMDYSIGWRICLVISSVSFEIIICFFAKGECHHHEQWRQISEQESWVNINIPTLRMGTSCERLIANWKKLKKSLNWLNRTIGRKLRILYFWLFTALDIEFGGSLIPVVYTRRSTFMSTCVQHQQRQSHKDLQHPLPLRLNSFRFCVHRSGLECRLANLIYFPSSRDPSSECRSWSSYILSGIRCSSSALGVVIHFYWDIVVFNI